ADFSIWRNIQREYAEELLGHDEYDGSGRPIQYAELEPFISMDRGMIEGRIRVFCVGVILDALTLAGDILTVAVIDPHLYDQLFADAIQNNAEGTVPARALPFERHTLEWLRRSGRLSPGTAPGLDSPESTDRIRVGQIGSATMKPALRVTCGSGRHLIRC